MGEEIAVKNNDKFKKVKVIAIVLICLIFLFLLVIVVLNSTIKVITEDEVKNKIILEMQPELTKLESEYGVKNVTLEINIDKIKIEPPTIFGKGKIRVEITDYIKSPSFTEFETQEYNESMLKKYSKIDGFLNYLNVVIDNYDIEIDKSFGSEETRFKDSQNNRYHFRYSTIHTKTYLYKNGHTVYSYGKGGNSSGGKCPVCNGTGYVKYYSDNYHYTSGKCSSCNGSGEN